MSDTAAVAIIAGMMGTILLLALAWYIVQVIALWKIFAKAGEPGWKALIPFYNGYIQFKISWSTTMFWILLACVFVGSILNSFVPFIGIIVSLAGTVISWISSHKLSLSFGHGIGFTLGLIFLNPIFILILGFGSSRYQGPQN